MVRARRYPLTWVVKAPASVWGLTHRCRWLRLLEGSGYKAAVSRQLTIRVIWSLGFLVGVGSTAGASCGNIDVCAEGCPSGGELFICYNTPGQGNIVSCQGNQAYADLWCYNVDGVAPAPYDCGYADGETGASRPARRPREPTSGTLMIMSPTTLGPAPTKSTPTSSRPCRPTGSPHSRSTRPDSSRRPPATTRSSTSAAPTSPP